MSSSKHLFGLRYRCEPGKFWLMYLWWATPGPELGLHYAHLERFKEALSADGIRFHYLTYQELIVRLGERLRGKHSQYIDYLSDRYL